MYNGPPPSSSSPSCTMDHHHHHHHVHWTTITITIMYHNGTSSSSPLWSLRFHWTSIRMQSRLGSRKAFQQKTPHFSFCSEGFASDIWVGHWSLKDASNKFVFHWSSTLTFILRQVLHWGLRIVSGKWSLMLPSSRLMGELPIGYIYFWVSHNFTWSLAKCHPIFNLSSMFLCPYVWSSH